jgi:hypothetical protein
VYVDGDLFVLGRGAGLNFSEILNYAIASILDVPYEEKALIRQKRQVMQDQIKQRFLAEKEAIMAEYLESEAANKEKEQVDRVIEGILKHVGVAVAKRRLYDPHGDYVEWWENLATSASQTAGTTVSVQDLQEAARRA